MRLKIPTYIEYEIEDTKGVIKNQYIEEDQTIQWPEEKVEKDKQRSTKHTYKTNDRITQTPLKSGGELRKFGQHQELLRFAKQFNYTLRYFKYILLFNKQDTSFTT